MEIRTGVPLAPYTTLKVGGAAEHLVEVTSETELQQVRQFAEQIDAPVLLLGGGSNVLVPDAGYQGVVIVNRITGIEYQSTAEGKISVTIGAGELLDDVVADTVKRGYWGLENLSHIPGTVGAAPIQNVGAYGVEVSALITSVRAVSLQSGEVRTFKNQDCQFAYRDSYFKTAAGREWLVTRVTCTLATDREPRLEYGDLQQLDQATCTLADVRAKVIEIRSSKFPDWHTVGTAGSFFKNPIISVDQHTQLLQQYPALPTFVMPDGRYKISLGWVLDKVCDLRGYRVGAVGLYHNQALVLINTGDSATAIEDFAAQIAALVYDKTAIKIEPEVRFV
jgi:UDP-N-acetylmuramate dehydrogenase